MPPLENPRREAFAQALARGVPLRTAYVVAGYKASNSNAAMLRRNCFIVARLHELQSTERPLITADASALPGESSFTKVDNGEPQSSAEGSMAEAELATVESLMRELELVRTRAMAEGQTRTAIWATMGKAKLQGFGDTRRTAGANAKTVKVFDFSQLTDAQLATLEAIFGPLAAAGADGGDRSGEGAKS